MGSFSAGAAEPRISMGVMKEITRREMCVGLSAVAATVGVVKAQTPAAPVGSAALSQSRVYRVDQMPVRKP